MVFVEQAVEGKVLMCEVENNRKITKNV